MGRRLLLFNRTCVTGRGALTPVWSAGATLYRKLGRIDEALGIGDWDEGLGWLAAQREPIAEVQFWGHGKWGAALVGSDAFDVRALSAASARQAKVAALAERLMPDALLWFRTCETLGAARGIAFAERLSDTLGARVAGHTFIIGFHQSGLHGVRPGMRADWPADEGLVEGTAEAPRRARWSTPFAPNTVTCLTGQVPARWFAHGAESSPP